MQISSDFADRKDAESVAFCALHYMFDAVMPILQVNDSLLHTSNLVID